MSEDQTPCLLFLGDDYYASGGWDDFEGSFDDIEAAVEHAKRKLCNGVKYERWFHVVSLGKVVLRGGWEYENGLYVVTNE
jgi:hypothetical protein